MEGLQARKLFADAGKLDGLARDRTHRERSTAARVAVELGEHDPGEWQRVAERLGHVHSVLPLHGVDDEQGFDRLERGVKLCDLAHHGLVDREAPGGIDEQHVVVVLPCVIERSQRNRARLLAHRRGEEIGAGLCRDRPQLLDCGRPVDVA